LTYYEKQHLNNISSNFLQKRSNVIITNQRFIFINVQFFQELKPVFSDNKDIELFIDKNIFRHADLLRVVEFYRHQVNDRVTKNYFCYERDTTHMNTFFDYDATIYL
ncbi:unnamed protein product, partial [Didymodactylos carnosus]